MLTRMAAAAYFPSLSVLVDAALPFDAVSCPTRRSSDLRTVPFVVIPLTATLYVAPLPVTIAVVAPAVPPSVTSPVAKSLTGSLKTTVKLIGELLRSEERRVGKESGTGGAAAS